MNSAAVLATRYARRPLLLEPNAARELVGRLTAADPRGISTFGRLAANLRKLGLGRAPVAAGDDGEAERDASSEDIHSRRPEAYAPLWAQQAYGDPLDEGFCWSLYDGVALMSVETAISAQGERFCGTWYHGYDTILAGLREAAADPRVQGIFLKEVSPGGVVDGGLTTLAEWIRDNRAAAGGKPIHVYAPMACSAAYWIAAQADRISAPRVGLVGSIGAVLVHEDVSGWLEKTGIKVTPIQFGSQKTAGADWGPLSPEALADLQAEIDQCGEDFVADVAAGRPKLTPEALIATQARVFMANHKDQARSGLALGFVDAVEGEEQAFVALKAAIPTPATAAKPGFSLPAAADAGRGAPKAQQEGQMAAETTQTKPTLAQLEARRAEIDAQISQARAEAAPAGGGEAAAAAPADDDELEDVLDPGEETETGPAAETEVAGDPPADQVDATAEAQAILASPEADANPHVAMAAVRDGLTFAQFKGQVAAQAKAPRNGALAAAMAGARRLGPDAARGANGEAGGESSLVKNAKQQRAAATRRP